MSDLEHLKLSPTYYIGLLKIFGHCDLIFGNGSCLDLLPIIMDRQEQRTRKLKWNIVKKQMFQTDVCLSSEGATYAFMILLNK